MFVTYPRAQSVTLLLSIVALSLQLYTCMVISNSLTKRSTRIENLSRDTIHIFCTAAFSSCSIAHYLTPARSSLILISSTFVCSFKEKIHLHFQRTYQVSLYHPERGSSDKRKLVTHFVPETQ